MIVPARQGHTNMFAEPAHIMVNTVNCMGISGAGIAKEMKRLYPEMHKIYKWACENGHVAPGQLHVWTDMDALKHGAPFFQVVNFPTKTHWRKDSDYDYIYLGLQALRIYLLGVWDQPVVSDEGHQLGTVARLVPAPLYVSIPALGCGNGNLNWAKVQPAIFEALKDVSEGMVITVFPPKGETHERYEDGHLCHRPAELD